MFGATRAGMRAILYTGAGLLPAPEETAAERVIERFDSLLELLT